MKVVIAEDDVPMARTFKLLLKPITKDVHIEHTLRELIEYLAIHSDVDIIIADIYMPGNDYDGLKRAIPMIRRMCPHAVLVIVSGITPLGAASEALVKEGADMFSEKKDIIRGEKLLEIIGMAFDRRKAKSPEERFDSALETIRNVTQYKKENPE